jgi:hypothetical protein
MRKQPILLIVLSTLLAVAFLSGCAGMKPTESNFKEPVVTLEFVEVAHYWGWWYFAKKVEPTMGEAGDYGAPLDLAFTFNVENPNAYAVRMTDIKFTVAFEEFDLNTVNSQAAQWIPPGKTNQIRVHAMFDGRQSLLSLLVTGGFKLKEKTGDAGAGAALKQLGEWWKAAPDYGFPIHVKEGSAVFKADGLTKVTVFNATFP